MLVLLASRMARQARHLHRRHRPTPKIKITGLQFRPRAGFFPVIPDLRPIINDIASRADEFLDGTKDRAQSRAGIDEFLTMDYALLSPPDRTVVITGVMSILEDEDFFGTEYVGDPFSDPEEPEGA